MHAPIAMSAMRQGLHVYVQKPLAHDIYEVRKLTEMARAKKLVTPDGHPGPLQPRVPDGRAGDPERRDRQGQGSALLEQQEVGRHRARCRTAPIPCPPALNWDGWLGVMAKRPFIGDEYYHPANWRKRIDFGTATFGDMGCHIYDPVFGALRLTAPISVRSEGPAPDAAQLGAQFGDPLRVPRDRRHAKGKTVAVTWYDGDERPPQEVQALIGLAADAGPGVDLHRDEGRDAAAAYGDADPAARRPISADYKMPQIEPINHYFQFVDAVLGKAEDDDVVRLLRVR